MPAILANLSAAGGARIRQLSAAVNADEPVRKAEFDAGGPGGGSGGTFTNSTTAPASPAEGDRWYHPTDSVLYTWVDTGGAVFAWVEL